MGDCFCTHQAYRIWISVPYKWKSNLYADHKINFSQFSRERMGLEYQNCAPPLLMWCSWLFWWGRLPSKSKQKLRYENTVFTHLKIMFFSFSRERMGLEYQNRAPPPLMWCFWLFWWGRLPSKSKQKRDTKISTVCLSRLGVRVYRRSQKVMPISWSLKENFGGSGDLVEQLPAKKPLLPIFSQIVMVYQYIALTIIKIWTTSRIVGKFEV